MTATLHPRGTLRARFEPVSSDLFRKLGVGARSCDLGHDGLYLAEELVAADAGWLGSGEHPEALAILVLALMIAQRQGSTRLPLDPKGPLRTFVTDISRLSGAELDVPRVLRTITNLTKSPRFNSVIGMRGARLPLVVDDDALYTERARWLEDRVAARLAERIASPARTGIERLAAAVSNQSTRPLSDEQRRAVEIALSNSIAVVTGGPGTGKTLVAAAIVRGFAAMGIEHVVLAAQTGKAANRLTEVIAEQRVEAEPAQTLHRLLNYRAGSRTFGHHAQSPLPVGAVIVDEASMIDLELVDALLDALPASAPLVLIGDAHQLPAIDAGQVLADLTRDKIASPVVAVLAKSYRQDTSDPDGLAVYEAARAIHDGEPAKIFEGRRPKDSGKQSTAGKPRPDGLAQPTLPGIADVPAALASPDGISRLAGGLDVSHPASVGLDGDPATIAAGLEVSPGADGSPHPAAALDDAPHPGPVGSRQPSTGVVDAQDPGLVGIPHPATGVDDVPRPAELAGPDDVPHAAFGPDDVPHAALGNDVPHAGVDSATRASRGGRRGALAVPRAASKLLFRGVEWVDTATAPRPIDVTLAVADALWLHLEGPKALRVAERVFKFTDGAIAPEDRADLEALWKLLSRGRILTVTRTLPTGSIAVNQHLHQLGLDRLSVTGRPDFVPGEPVMVTANDHQRGLFNGDQGIIVRADEGLGRHHYRAVFRQGGELRPFAIEALRDRLELAWALTIHKSQGSELDTIALLLPHDDIPLVTRELLYTGITRAKRSVVIAGAKQILVNGAKRQAQRHSGLGERLRATLR
jgi:hypothetical protein